MGWPVRVRVGDGDDGRGCVVVVAVDVGVGFIEGDLVVIGEVDGIDRWGGCCLVTLAFDEWFFPGNSVSFI